MSQARIIARIFSCRTQGTGEKAFARRTRNFEQKQTKKTKRSEKSGNLFVPFVFFCKPFARHLIQVCVNRRVRRASSAPVGIRCAGFLAILGGFHNAPIWKSA